jgi:hypothetical protein
MKPFKEWWVRSRSNLISCYDTKAEAEAAMAELAAERPSMGPHNVIRLVQVRDGQRVVDNATALTDDVMENRIQLPAWRYEAEALMERIRGLLNDADKKSNSQRGKDQNEIAYWKSLAETRRRKLMEMDSREETAAFIVDEIDISQSLEDPRTHMYVIRSRWSLPFGDVMVRERR